jgi:hypothetical protein
MNKELHVTNIISTCKHFKTAVSESNKKQRRFHQEFAVKIQTRLQIFAAELMSRVANRAMHTAVITFAQGRTNGEDLPQCSMCGFAACVRQTSYLKNVMLTLSLSIDSLMASDDRIRTRPWLLMRMSLGPSAPAGMPETKIERSD